LKTNIPLFPIQSEWLPPLDFPDLSEAKEIAIDLETCDPNMDKYGPGWPRKDGFVVGYAVAVDGWKGYYPIAHAGGGNLDKRIVERWITKILLLPCDKVMHNAAYDVGWLRASGFTVNGRIIDTMIAAALIDENRFSYALNSLGYDYLKETKSEQGLRDAAADFGLHPKKELWKLPAMYVGAYAEQDAALTLKLWHHFQILMRDEEVESIFNLETELLPILIDITFRGIRFDRDRAIALITEMKHKEKKLLTYIKDVSGVPVDMWAAATIAKAFDKLNIPYPQTTTGLPSFTKSFLDTCEHPIAKAIMEARELNKTYGTFLQPYIDFSAHDGRIHPHINQLRSDDGGTVTGRLSMASPNLQQVPARHEIIGPMVRSLFLPEEGQHWAACDFSSQEPRLLVHYANLLQLDGARDMAQAYITDIDTDFHQMIADMAGIKRKVAKTIGLGLCIAQGEMVLTDSGLVPIQQVTELHKVWDGVEWVSHEGVFFMGTKEVITYGNLTATPDHDVWTNESGKISLRLAASRLDALVSTGDAEQAIRYVDRDQQGGSANRKTSVRESAMRLWGRGLEALGQPQKWKVNYVPTMHYAQAACGTRALDCKIYRDEVTAKKGYGGYAEMPKPQGQRLETLWWPWNSMRVFLRKGLCGISAVLAPCFGLDGNDHRPDQQRGKLRSGKPPKSFLPRKQPEQKKYAKVYDIINAGPRHRFTVSNVLVSNCYGMGKGKLAVQLDLPVEDASELITTFHRKVPFLKGTIEAVMKAIERPASGGSIRTLLGRKCRFPLWEPTEWGVHKALPYEEATAKYGPRIKRAMTYKGLNKLLQGSAADQTKAAMVALHKAGFTLLLQVHDEIAVSVSTPEEARTAADIMVAAVKLTVPSKADMEIGPSWGSAK
jgi:DNA polymerase I-like protein with 3'-5' exonuclease and polymerase domains